MLETLTFPIDETMAQDLNDAARGLLEDYRDINPGGFSDTPLEAVRFFYTDRAIPREPLSYPPGLAVILSGKKIGFLGGRRFEYGAGTYLAIGPPMIFECETHASIETPLFGLFLTFKPEELRELRDLLEDDGPRLPTDSTLGVEPLSVKPAMRDAITRLIRQIRDSRDAAALAPGTVREIFYHALQDAHGRVLLSLTRLNRPEARIAALLTRVETLEDPEGAIPTLAREAGMSRATLYRHFKRVTGYPPNQYFKRQRLMRARHMLMDARRTVTDVAFAVGYKGVAQFSRDFRAFFGHPPSQARSREGRRAD